MVSPRPTRVQTPWTRSQWTILLVFFGMFLAQVLAATWYVLGA